jgi:hypothetical protein
MQKEIWKEIEGYEGYYQISNFGRVRSVDRLIPFKGRPRKHKGCVIKGSLSGRNRDYVTVILKKRGECKNFNVHRLVAIHFIPNPDNKPTVNHKNGNKQDNSVSNLEWATYKENINHAQKMGLFVNNFKGYQPHRNKNNEHVYQYSLDGYFIMEHFSILEAARANGIPKSGISRVCRGLQKSHYGFYFSKKMSPRIDIPD